MTRVIGSAINYDCLTGKTHSIHFLSIIKYFELMDPAAFQAAI